MRNHHDNMTQIRRLKTVKNKGRQRGSNFSVMSSSTNNASLKV